MKDMRINMDIMKFINDLLDIPLVEDGYEGWRLISKKLNIVTEDGPVENITCYTHRGDFTFTLDNKEYRLPQFTSYSFS